MKRIFVTRTWPGDALARLEAVGYSVDVWDGFAAPAADALAERAKGAHALITTVEDRVGGDLIDAIGRPLALIAQAGVGTDNIDVAAAATRRVAVTNAPGVLTEATADLAFALLAATARRVADGDRYVRQGRWTCWHPELFLGPELHGATVGIVGFGRIGQSFARRCRGFGMNILYTATSPKEEASTLQATHVPLDELLERSDFVSLHTPLTPETEHLIDAARLGSMRDEAVLINTARGKVVDTMALVAALQENRIGGAGLDVTEPEPLPADHPFLELPNVIVTPHIGSAGKATRAAMLGIAVDNCLSVLSGKPPISPIT
jgi:glyoxylate reductase